MDKTLYTQSYSPPKRKDLLKCTCEINNLKNASKESLMYSMCDICSDRVFTREIQSSDHEDEK
jgi:hypothetical protein